MSIKMISVHDASQIEALKECLHKKQPSILIVKITSLISGYPDARTKLVNELHSNHLKNNYSVFRLAEDRFVTIPDSIKVENIV